MANDIFSEAGDEAAQQGTKPTSGPPDTGMAAFMANNPWVDTLAKKVPNVSIPKDLVESGGAIDPYSIPGMEAFLGPKPAEEEDIFSAAGADEPEAQPDGDDIFSMAGAGQSASELAKHRWERLKKLGPNEMPTAAGDIDYKTLTKTSPSLTEQELEAQRAQGISLGGGRYTQGLLTGKTEGAPLFRQHTKEEIPGRLKRGFRNLPESAYNLVAAGPAMAAGMVPPKESLGRLLAGYGSAEDLKKPAETIKGAAEYIGHIFKVSGKAAVWSQVNQINPVLGSILESHGIGPVEFADQVADDPFGTIVTIAEGIRLGGKVPGKVAKATSLPAIEGLKGPRGGAEVPPTRPNMDTMTPEAYEKILDGLARKKAMDEMQIAQKTAAKGPASESAKAFTGRPVITVDSHPITHFEAALDDLRTRLSEGGAPGKLSQKALKGKRGGIHPITAILAEYQLIHPELTMDKIKRAFTADKDAMLREIAFTRASEAIKSVTEAPRFADIKDRKAPSRAATAEGIGSEQTAAINRPLGDFDTSRTNEMRKASKTVDEYENTRKAEPKGTILGSGAGGLQKLYDKLVEKIKSKRANPDEPPTPRPDDDMVQPDFMVRFGQALLEGMENPTDISISPEDMNKLKHNKAVPGADYVPTPTPEWAAATYSPILERRSFDSQRAHITDTVSAWHDKAMSFNDAHDAVELMKERGSITGAQESAFIREIQKKYADPELTRPSEESSFIAPEEANLDLERKLSEQRQARPPLSRDPQGPSFGPLADEPKGPTMGSGLGGMQGQLEKTWSNAARIAEELPDLVKGESLLNLFSKHGQKIGVPFTKSEMRALDLDKFVEQNRGRQVDKKDLRTWIADRVVRTQEIELGENVFDQAAYDKKLAEHRFARTVGNTAEVERLKDQLGVMEVARDESKPKFLNTEGTRLPGGTNYREIKVNAPKGTKLASQGHFDPETIAHMRLTDRENGKLLFSEEFQSDLNKSLRKGDKAVSHPLADEWKETLFKRLVRKGAEEGKEAVGWTTGKQQAERYNLRKHVEHLSLERLDDGKYGLIGTDRFGGNPYVRKLALEELPNVVGKEAAALLTEGEAGEALRTTGHSKVSGKQLEFGGNWATDLYDRQMVDIANKWAKKFGGKVEPGNIEGQGPIHTVRLTDTMKKSLLEEGNPTFGFLTKEGHAEAVQNLKNLWKNMGRTLGSAPGEPIYGLFENLTKIGLYHLKNGVTDFTAWSEAIRKDADSAGFSVTDAMLRDSWNAQASKDARMPIRPAAAIASAITNMNVQTPSSLTVGQANVNTATRLMAPDVGTGATSMDALTNGEMVSNVLHRLWVSDFGTRSGLDSHARTYFPTAMEAATQHVNAQGISFLKASRHISELRNIFDPKNKEVSQQYLHDFADLVADNRARALRKLGAEKVEAIRKKLDEEYQQAVTDGRTEDASAILAASKDLGPAQVDMVPMNDYRRTRLLMDPKIQAAIEYWKTRIAPEIDLMSTKLGLLKTLGGDLGLYVKFRQVDLVTAKKMQRTRPIGEYTPEPGEGPSVSSIGTTRLTSPHASRPGRSGSAKAATGKLREGHYYENDLRHMLENTYIDRVLAETKNRFHAEIKRSALASKSTNGTKPVPKKVQVGGILGKKVWENVVPITLEGTNPYNGDTHYVPQTVARLFDETMHVNQNNVLRNLWDLQSSFATSLVIASPAEAVRHGFNAVAATVNTSFYGKHGKLAESAEAFVSSATLGASKIVTAIGKAYHLEGLALADAIERYGAAGGLRLSGYEGTHVQRSAVIRAVDKLPGMHTAKEIVFGDPGSKKGFAGMETRLRIVIGEVIREMNPHLSDVEVAGKLNDAFGTYVDKLQPSMTKLFLPFDPFARAGTGLTRTGVRLLEGKDVSGKYNPIIHAQVAGTLAAIIGWNMLMDDEHKAPWEHPEYKFGDVVLLRRDGKIYSLGYTDLANSLKRGMEFLGLNAGINAIIRGERSPVVIGKEMLRGTRNSLVNRASPLIKMLSRFTTGRSLATSPSGDAYSIGKAAMTSSKRGSPIWGILDAANEAFPLPGKLSTVAKEVISPLTKEGSMLRPEYDKTMPESWLARVLMDAGDVVSVPYMPKITTEEKVASKASDVQNRIQQEYTGTVRSIAREALNFPEDKREAYVMHQIDLRIGPEIITELGNPQPAQPAAFKSIMSMLLRASAYNTKKEILQSINNDPIDGPVVPTPQAPQPPAAPQPSPPEDSEPDLDFDFDAMASELQEIEQ